jgi:hypothetical protein
MGRGAKVISVKPGSPITKVFRPEDKMWLGHPRCAKAQEGPIASFPDVPAQKVLCARAGLPLQVGKFIFTDPTETAANSKWMQNQGVSSMYEDQIGIEGLSEDALSELSAQITKHNLTQTAIAGAIGGGAGLLLPWALQMWKTKAPAEGNKTSFGEVLKMSAPALLLGGVAAWYAANNKPLIGGALASAGALLSFGMFGSRFLFNRTSATVTIAFDAPDALVDAVAAKLAATEAATAAIVAPIDDGLSPTPLDGYDDVLALDGYVVEDPDLEGLTVYDEADPALAYGEYEQEEMPFLGGY